MANDYTSSTDCFAELTDNTVYRSSSDYDTVFEPAMAGFVTSASRLIDAEMGRWDGFFYPTTDTKTNYYDGSGLEEQEIDEFVSISSVSVAEQGGVASTDYTAWTENTDYLTWPYNASNKGRPITRLDLDLIDGSKPGWYRYQKSVKVAGIPGYSATPPRLVVQACKRQAIRWFMQARQAYQDESASVELGQMVFKARTELDPDIKKMLWPLKLELDR